MGSVAWAVGLGLTKARPAAALAGTLSEAFAQIEAESGGRLGVAVLDTPTGAHAGHRVDERFPLCSMFKLLAAGAVLARIFGKDHARSSRAR